MCNNKHELELDYLVDKRLFGGFAPQWGTQIKTIYSIIVANRELKKLRRLLQRKRHIKIELCARLSVI